MEKYGLWGNIRGLTKIEKSFYKRMKINYNKNTFFCMYLEMHV